MKPVHRNRRLRAIAIGAVALVAGVGMLASALSQNRQYFYEPSTVASVGFTPRSDNFRVGGLVLPGSVSKSDGLVTTFRIADFETPDNPPLTVTYTGILPDLFKEDSGVVVTGELRGGILVASTLLAKHDENYMPKIDYDNVDKSGAS